MEIDLDIVHGQQRYKLATGTVLPRPIAWVSSVDKDGNRNLAPYSFFTIAAYNPLIFAIFPLRFKKDEQIKDTVWNILQTGEAVIHIANQSLIQAMNMTAATVEHDVDEFQLAGIESVPSIKVKPDRVKQAPVAFECRLYQHLSLGDVQGGSDALFLEAIYMHIDDQLIDDYRIDHHRLDPIARLAGSLYTTLGQDLEVIRPA